MRAIITFHSLDTSGSVISYPPQLFSRFISVLAASDLPVCDLDTLLRNETEHGVALTFDDGMATLYSHALPVLRDHQLPAHLFLATGAVGLDNRWPSQPTSTRIFEMLTWDQIETCSDNGIFIESHTVSHPDLRRLNAQRLAEECERADEEIKQRIGRSPSYFAYPYGYSNQQIRDYTRSRYRASVTVELRPLSSNDDRAALPRLDSYYLRSPRVQGHLDSWVIRSYLRGRGIMRRVRGTQ